MKIRALVPVIILSLLHAYIGFRLLPDLAAGAAIRESGAAALLASCALMLAGLMARSIETRTLADRLAAVGLFAASFFSSLLVLTLMRDLVLLLGVLALPAGYLRILTQMTARAVVALAVFVTLVGFAGARRHARIVKVDVPLAELPPALQGFTIAQISDVHVGAQIKRPYVDAIVDAVNGLKADVIAVTGDLVDGSVPDLAQHIAPLGRLHAQHGAFLVTGNHEYYSGAGPWTAEFRRLGLQVLLNEHVVLRHAGARVIIAGVTDYSAHHFDPAQRSDPSAALAGAPADAGARILLAHQPRSAA